MEQSTNENIECNEDLDSSIVGVGNTNDGNNDDEITGVGNAMTTMKPLIPKVNHYYQYYDRQYLREKKIYRLSSWMTQLITPTP